MQSEFIKIRYNVFLRFIIYAICTHCRKKSSLRISCSKIYICYQIDIPLVLVVFIFQAVYSQRKYDRVKEAGVISVCFTNVEKYLR